MKTSFPDINQHNNHQHAVKENVIKKLSQTPPKINVKGITLKEYFQMCEEPIFQETINQIQNQSSVSQSSLAQTPTFHDQQTKRHGRAKMKTEVYDESNDNKYKNNMIKQHLYEIQYTYRGYNQNAIDKSLKNHTQDKDKYAFKKKDDRKKIYSKIHSQSNKQQLQLMNRSTLNSFYQIEENKKKMLRKMQAERQRINQMRLSEAFFITKYGSKFKIDNKILIKNQ